MVATERRQRGRAAPTMELGPGDRRVMHASRAQGLAPGWIGLAPVEKRFARKWRHAQVCRAHGYQDIVAAQDAFLRLSRSCCSRCLAVRLMNYELRRDEELYVPPIRLLEESRLYLDFFYNHPPGSAWWFYGIRQLTGSEYLLLDGRLGVLAGWLVYAAGIGLVSFALTRSALASWCIVVLSLANELFLTQTGMTATNNFLPLPFSFLGLALFILGVSQGQTRPVLDRLGGILPVGRGGFQDQRCGVHSAGGDRRLLHAAL